MGLDSGSIVAYFSGAGAPVGLAFNGLSFANGAATACLCGLNYSTGTSLAPMFIPPSYNKVSVAISAADAALTISGN